MMIQMNASAEMTKPSTAINRRGDTEKLVIPSSAYLNKLQKLHFVVPTVRSTFWYSTHLVSKPTQQNKPFEKRCFSHSLMMLSTIWRDMIR